MTERESAMPETPFECPRCGSDEWDYCDYGGCSDCRSHEDRAAEDEEDRVKPLRKEGGE